MKPGAAHGPGVDSIFFLYEVMSLQEHLPKETEDLSVETAVVQPRREPWLSKLQAADPRVQECDQGP